MRLNICFVSIIQFLSCSKEQNPIEITNTEMIYPLTVGNEWSYVRLFSIFNFRPLNDSIVPPNDMTILQRSVSSISRKDTLHDTISTFVLRELLEEGNSTFVGESYLSNHDDGLYLYAYKGISNTSPKVAHSQKISFKGRNFNHIGEITSFIENGGLIHSPNFDSLRFENPPVKALPRKYRTGEQWTFRRYIDFLRIDKKIISKESIETHAGNFDCYKVQWLVDFGNDGEWDKDIIFFDWVSLKGLIRRNILIKDMIWVGSASPEPLGKFDGKDEFILINFKNQ